MKRLFSALLLLAFTSTAQAAKVDTYIPKNAYEHLPTVAVEANRLNVEFTPWFIAGLVEQESCLSLTHSRCWKATSNFKRKWKGGKRREEGGGLLMLTRTWTRSGKIRFDTLTRLVRQHPVELRGLSWKTVYNRPDLQIKAGILLLRGDWDRLPSTIDHHNRELMVGSAYNQGFGGLKSDRRICGLKKHCNPNLWFGHVEDVKRRGFATRKLIGKRTAWDVNRSSVKSKHRRTPKYERYFKKDMGLDAPVTTTKIEIVKRPSYNTETMPLVDLLEEAWELLME